MDAAPPPPASAVIVDRQFKEGGKGGEEAKGIAIEVARPARPSFSFEELFGRRLPIWAGGVTLAVAGVLLVKYSIDAGLLPPLVRVVLGLLFGGEIGRASCRERVCQ